MIWAFRQFVGANAMMAYLVMMAPRLVELRRVLKPTGSIYLHCGPTASHYLKVLMDTIFGKENFRSEITWKRTSAHQRHQAGQRAAWSNPRCSLVLHQGQLLEVESDIYGIRPGICR